MSMVEDLNAFLSTAEFADNATLGGVAVVGVFDNAFDPAAVGLSGMASALPSFTLASSNVPSNVVGLSLVHKSVTYNAAETHPDGTGMTLLILERA